MADRYRVMKPGHPGDWIVLRGTPDGWELDIDHGFRTWRSAFDYADDRARYRALERQYLTAVEESRGAHRRGPEGWRS